VVSGGFSWFVERLGKRLDVDYVFANVLEIEDGVLTGKLVPPILDGPGKAERLERIAAGEGVPVDQVVGVGDGANDIPMLQRAGLGIAFRAAASTRRSADAAIQRNTFAGLLHLLGVSARDMRRLGGDE
jgi:phosphoserine phosphatase